MTNKRLKLLIIAGIVIVHLNIEAVIYGIQEALHGLDKITFTIQK